jgi:hypothetical protein
LAELTSKIDQARVEELVATYPKLADYLELPPQVLIDATTKAATAEQARVRSLYSDPDIAPWLVNPDNPNDPDYQPWFTSADLANTSAADGTAGIPIVAYPDFALRWAFWFWDSDHPDQITRNTDRMIQSAYLSAANAKHYEDSVAGEGQVGHAKAVRSDVIGAMQRPDGKLFVGTVTEYEPGNGEPTGRVDVRWSEILPSNGAIKAAPANADFSTIASQEYLGNAPTQ